MTRAGPGSWWAIFRWPLLVGALALVGLTSALTGDGAWDALSWITLGLPPLGFSAWVMWKLLRRPR